MSKPVLAIALTFVALTLSACGGGSGVAVGTGPSGATVTRPTASSPDDLDRADDHRVGADRIAPDYGHGVDDGDDGHDGDGDDPDAAHDDHHPDLADDDAAAHDERAGEPDRPDADGDRDDDDPCDHRDDDAARTDQNRGGAAATAAAADGDRDHRPAAVHELDHRHDVDGHVHDLDYLDDVGRRDDEHVDRPSRRSGRGRRRGDRHRGDRDHRLGLGSLSRSSRSACSSAARLVVEGQTPRRRCDSGGRVRRDR